MIYKLLIDVSKKREYYLVDGYNLIHAWQELKNEDFAAARDHLIHILIEYGAYEKLDITLVFDAGSTEEEEHAEKYGDHFTVIYTAPNDTADNVIERLVYELVKQRREIHVVSSDAIIETVILGAGAYRHPSREFYRAVKRAKQHLRREYLSSVTLPLVRSEVGDRLDDNVFAKLEELRRKK